MTVKLTINSENIDAPPGPSLFDYAEQLGVRVPTSCRKQGKCRECLMEVVEGMDSLSPRSEEEAHLTENFRLSCRTHITADTGQVRCHTLRRGAMRIETQSRALDTMPTDAQLDPAVTRCGDRILLDGREIDRSTGPIHGLAFDLGTTTCVLHLFDLETGTAVATSSFENPQRFGGSEVMARIQYDTDHKGRLLQRTLLGYLTHAIEDLEIDPHSIYEMVIAGNATMRDIFFGLNVYSIGQRPYRSITELEMAQGQRTGTSLSTTAKKLRLPLCPDARIYGLPLISGHVGADAAACLLAINIANEQRTVALMDIGTNTELIVGHRDKILAASCPAGPAFEGGKISCGMPGLEGAIERVALGPNGEVETTVIGDSRAQGICGSGLIDLLGELRRTDRMDIYGRYVDDSDAFTIDTEQNIYLHERDINELAQAKGANVAGLHIILKNFGVAIDDIDLFYLAGGFGRHLNIEAAKRIGLIPDLDDDKIVQIGNASIAGAAIALLSISRRRELEDRVQTITHVELETDPNFFDYFVFGCQFKPLNGHALESLG